MIPDQEPDCTGTGKDIGSSGQATTESFTESSTAMLLRSNTSGTVETPIGDKLTGFGTDGPEGRGVPRPAGCMGVTMRAPAS